MNQIDHINTTERGASQTAGTPVNTTAAQTDTAADSARKNIQARLMDARKQRQALSMNTEISAQEREKRRQQIEQEISDLKRELRLQEAEEKKKQQEEQKAIARKEEQQKDAASKSAVQSSENTDDRKRTANDGSDSKHTDETANDGQVSELLPNGMHRIISAGSATQQFSIVQNTSSKADAAFKIQEAELSQDAARGADVRKMRQGLQEQSKKEMQRMDMVHTVIFGSRNNKSNEPAIGIKNRTPAESGTNGIYRNNGMISHQNFQSMQLDVILS